MEATPFKMPLYLPAQGATESEVTLIEWHVAEGDRFSKGQPLVQIDSAKSVFDFEAPCDGLVLRRFHLEGETLLLTDAIMEIETNDPEMRDWIPPAAACEHALPRIEPGLDISRQSQTHEPIVFLGFGGYLPRRVVTNAELVEGFPEITPEYVYQVTGIRERRWADADEKPSGMAYQAALEAIRRSGIAAKDIDAVIVATTTPDVAMPSTAAILQDRLNLQTVPAFDLNAACSGWLYAVSMAHGMILSGTARNVLTVGVDMQSRLLDKSDRSAYFLLATAPARRLSRRANKDIASATCCLAPILVACTWRGVRSRAIPFRMATGMRSTRGFGSTATHCSGLPPKASPTLFGRQSPRAAGPWTIPAGSSPIRPTPNLEGGVQAERHAVRAILSQRRSCRQHVERKHPHRHGRGRGKTSAGRQAGPLLGRRRHDHRSYFRGMVIRTCFAGD